ncbi:MAG: SDR family oxidoreductase [Bradymonadaceae bacterium]|nr:SDR family oxidoreductase [Lujinxingiaceae bacterium]
MIFRDALFEGKVVLITGGGTGIGREMARDFARLGARVAIAARREAKLRETVDLIEAEGGKASLHLLDIRDADAIAACIDDVCLQWGPIDVLINNAGGNFIGPAAAMSPNGWRTVIDINLNGTFLMCREVGNRMLSEGRGGRIINISATNAYNGSPLMAHSGASKAGMNSLTETLAVEWGGAGITVNAVLPGPVRTDGSDERLWTDAEMVERLESRIPLGRFGTPEDISPIVLFLASEAGAFVTGSLIVVDGGDRLRSTLF